METTVMSESVVVAFDVHETVSTFICVETVHTFICVESKHRKSRCSCSYA
jgi:hypothetical protein